ncbi:ABC transporter substrate-binding protein [Mycolicibacterium grossiae]|uniref:Nitrate ABC transporter substrate-binding protein n=1 Tax=Mycolicibacterium grossiae TaxID=1552759 RepID=A0A1E8Q886_9MYCO|nr:ABC transporter substrate-binding protein [Mycolicibacterium grossiae]OFJ54461.1 nitrate ABC transporter substrate-binding protein [Mycolicibacterium grossiae]QEM45877.1 ABC transporter substrate-binding protein [Mycolicibacterium grossiae]
MIKRQLTAAALAVATAATLALAGCADQERTNAVKVGIVCGGLSLAALAIDEGQLDGVAAERVCFDSGSDAVQALSGGSIDAFVGAGEHVVRNRIKNLDVKGYAVTSQVPPYALVTSTTSGISRVADLAGRSVAVTAPGSLSDTELQRAVADAGIDYEGLRVVGSGTGATMQATIDKGGAAAGMVTDPLLTTMVQSGRFRVLWKPDFQYVALTVIARESWAQSHQDALGAFVRGVDATLQRGTTDFPATLEAAKKQAPDLDQKVLEPVLRTTLEQAPPGLIADARVYRDTVALLEQVGQVEPGAAPSYEDAFDFSLLRSP